MVTRVVVGGAVTHCLRSTWSPVTGRGARGWLRAAERCEIPSQPSPNKQCQREGNFTGFFKQSDELAHPIGGITVSTSPGDH